MADELMVREETSVAAPAPPSLMEIIAGAARDPSVDVSKMQALLDMAEVIRAREAETEFNRAMNAAQSEIAPVVRNADNPQARSKYARLETIDAAIRPIYTRHGFSLSFDSDQSGGLSIVCDVRHVAGHIKRYSLPAPLDTAGPKGMANKTEIQGLGSTVSYLRRYLTLMVFNVPLKNEDDDGQMSGSISIDQQNQLRDLIIGCEMTPDGERKFLEFAGAESVETIRRYDFERCKTALRTKLRKLKEGA